MIERNIHLLEEGKLINQIEKDVIDIVSQACTKFTPNINARVAGGWVRDKLLGKDSDDVDITVDRISGLEFAEKMKEITLSSPTPAYLEANPEQTKHLETARICLFNSFWLDVCALRCDEYTTESRIPTIRMGTPQEDAERRDFTVNSIFYNINNRKVEDFTGGIPDLKNKILRTQLDPLISFKDDPLRILRAFRFAARFSLVPEKTILNAIPEVIDEFEKKISRPRIEMEISKALGGPDPLSVIRWCAQTNMFIPIFNPHKKWELDEQNIIHDLEIISSRLPDNNRFPVVLSIIYRSIYVIPTKKNNPLDVAIIKTMNSTVKIYDFSNRILKGLLGLDLLNEELTRVKVGRWIREIGEIWPFTRCIITDNVLLEFYDNTLIPFIETENLNNIYDLKPILNGKEVAALHKVKPGPILSKLIEQLIDWQINNPNSGPEDYKSFILSTQ